MKLGNNPISINQALINGTFKDALSFGAYIAIVIPLILGLCFVFKGIARIFLILQLSLSLYMIFFTGSKSGLTSLFASMLLFLFLSLKVVFDLIKSKSQFLKKICLSFFSIVLIFAVILGLVLLKRNIVKEITQSSAFFRTKGIVQQKNLKAIFGGRADTLWKMAIPMIKDYPLTGVGIGGYIIEVANYSEAYKTPIGVPESAGNYLLQVGSELGLIGVFLVLWILWEIFKQIRDSSMRIASNDRFKFILIGSIAGVTSFLLISLAHTFIGSYEIKYTFWLLVGIIFCMGRIAQDESMGGEEKAPGQKLRWRKGLKITSISLIILFSTAHLWNSTHSLSLKSRTERLGIKQDFGFYQHEKTKEGMYFRWTREYGGLTLQIEKPLMSIPILASHPDIYYNAVKVKVYLVKEFFKEKKLLEEITLTRSIWQTHEFYVPKEVGQEVILLFKVSRTWNPLKWRGTPDPRNLGIAIGKIEFEDRPAL